MCDRVPNLDLRFFVTSVGIQRQTGGDLAEILDKIGYVIRERFRILGQVKALTGEGRLSGMVLIALPFALFVFMLNASRITSKRCGPPTWAASWRACHHPKSSERSGFAKSSTSRCNKDHEGITGQGSAKTAPVLRDKRRFGAETVDNDCSA